MGAMKDQDVDEQETRAADTVALPPRASGSLALALVAAQKAAGAVLKKSTNEFHRYKYASSEAVITEAREALSDAGLSVMCSESLVHSSESLGPILNSEYILTHVSGERAVLHYTTPIIPDKGRPLDKAVGAARTYSLSYCLRDLLLLPRVEPGTEVDTRDDRQHDPKSSVSRAIHEASNDNGPGLAKAGLGDVSLQNDIASLERDAIAAKNKTELGIVYSRGLSAQLPKEEHDRLVAACRKRSAELNPAPVPQ